MSLSEYDWLSLDKILETMEHEMAEAFQRLQVRDAIFVNYPDLEAVRVTGRKECFLDMVCKRLHWISLEKKSRRRPKCCSARRWHSTRKM